ncbi:hypothetical protein [Streptomyces sp. 7N604]|uniref:hypothetical protein n=1 Tax=Streptomyces sp. 7N604 TaxID=3457415 RepID=UPI003FD37AA9
MTHSGQGNEPQLPAARPAHEGVVLPANGDPPYVPGEQAAPAAGQPWGQPWGPESAQAQQNPPAPPAAPAQPDAWASQSPSAQPGAWSAPENPPAAQLDAPPRDPSAQLDPPAQPGAWAPPALQPPAAGQAPHGLAQGGPQPGGGGNDADSQATQHIPQISPEPPTAGSGPLPPEAPSESTTFLGRMPLPQPRAQPQSQSQPHQADGDPDAEATQYIAPVPGGPAAQGGPQPPGRAPFGIRPGMPGDRQPPAEFDGLFRSEAPAPGAGPESPGSTQQMPRFTQPPQPPQQPHGAQQAQAPYTYEPEGRAARRNAERRRGLSPAALIGIVVAGCAIAGLAAGAALSGSGDQKNAAKNATQSTDAGAGGDSGQSSPAPDPAEKQAKDLDGLLADSNDSRAAVIRAVENIKTCTNLGQAAEDLRGAAGQRNGLVTRLEKLSVDKLPDHQALTSSLTSAWKASASADNHYAAWADQVAAGGKKTCRGGKARVTGHTAAANRASGDATTAKKQASRLWNSIAEEYALTQRQFTQL